MKRRKAKRSKRKYFLEILVKGITKKNRHAEISTGHRKGREIW